MKILLSLAFLLMSCPLLAQPIETAVPQRALHLQADGQDLPNITALQLAVERELGVVVRVGQPVANGDAVLIVRQAGVSQAEVRFTLANAPSIGRVISLPAEPARAAETIALLAANLIRNEANELLDELRRSKPPAKKAETPEILDPPKIVASPVVVAQPPAVAARAEYREELLGVDFVPRIGWPPAAGQKTLRRISLGLVASYSTALQGFSAAGLATFHRDWLHGVQLAGVVNFTAGDVQGIQASGTLNYAGSISNGAQLSVINVSNGDVKGGQIGVFNLARGEVSGVQIGVLNLGRNADAGIGLLSLYSNGRTQLEAWTQQSGLTMLGLKHGSRLLHNILAFGVRQDGDKFLPVAAFGWGGRWRWSERLALDLDAIEHVLFFDQPHRAPDSLSQLRALVQVGLFKGLSVFAGPTLNATISQADSQRAADTLDAFVDAGRAWKGKPDPRVNVSVWPGVVVGIAAF